MALPSFALAACLDSFDSCLCLDPKFDLDSGQIRLPLMIATIVMSAVTLTRVMIAVTLMASVTLAKWACFYCYADAFVVAAVSDVGAAGDAVVASASYSD